MRKYVVMTKHSTPLAGPWPIHRSSRRAAPANTARSKAAHTSANPALTALLEDLQDVLGVHTGGDKLRAILDHRGENTFTVQIHERHAAHVHDAIPVSILTV